MKRKVNNVPGDIEVKTELQLIFENIAKELTKMESVLSAKIIIEAQKIIEANGIEVVARINSSRYTQRIEFKLEDNSTGRFVFGSDISIRIDKGWDGEKEPQVVFEPLGGAGSFNLRTDYGRREAIRLQAWVIDNVDFILEAFNDEKYILKQAELEKYRELVDKERKEMREAE